MLNKKQNADKKTKDLFRDKSNNANKSGVREIITQETEEDNSPPSPPFTSSTKRMTVNDLMMLLESCHSKAEIKIAVLQANRKYQSAELIGLTRSLHRDRPRTHKNGTIWLLSDEPDLPVHISLWHPARRIKP